VKHLLSCSARVASRAAICSTIQNELSSLSVVCFWIESNGLRGLELQKFLCFVFDVIFDVNNNVCWRVMIGAYSDNEASYAMNQIGQTGRERWLPVMQRIRVILFEYVYSMWCELRSL
jgi:hypothetical protein